LLDIFHPAIHLDALSLIHWKDFVRNVLLVILEVNLVLFSPSHKIFLAVPDQLSD